MLYFISGSRDGPVKIDIVVWKKLLGDVETERSRSRYPGNKSYAQAVPAGLVFTRDLSSAGGLPVPPLVDGFIHPERPSC